MIEILEIRIEEEVLQHLFSKGSMLVGRGLIDRVVVAHFEIQISDLDMNWKTVICLKSKEAQSMMKMLN
jgi:hypothetical protein